MESNGVGNEEGEYMKQKGYVCDICGNSLDFWKDMYNIKSRKVRKIKLNCGEESCAMKRVDICENCFDRICAEVAKKHA